MDGMRPIEQTREAVLGSYDADACDLLATLLGYAGVKDERDALAHSLLDGYGSIERILNQKYKELLKNDGMKEHCAVLLSSIFPILSRSHTDALQKTPLGKEADAGRFFVCKYLGIKEERAYMLLLDSDGMYIDCSEISIGDVSTAAIYHGKIVERIIDSGAHYVAIAHNHPFGTSTPSSSDREVSDILSDICQKMRVTFMGHFVVGANTYSIA